MMTDPIADMLTRIRNALHVRKRRVDMPASNMKKAIADLLVREGYIKSVKLIESPPQHILRLTLRYTEDKKSVIEGIERVSRPGLRQYADTDHIPKVLGGFGTSIISTSKGLLTGHEARMQGVGGEVVCRVW